MLVEGVLEGGKGTGEGEGEEKEEEDYVLKWIFGKLIPSVVGNRWLSKTEREKKKRDFLNWCLLQI